MVSHKNPRFTKEIYLQVWYVYENESSSRNKTKYNFITPTQNTSVNKTVTENKKTMRLSLNKSKAGSFKALFCEEITGINRK